MAEREGFEPSVGDYPYDGLANRYFRPLSHLSDEDESAQQTRSRIFSMFVYYNRLFGFFKPAEIISPRERPCRMRIAVKCPGKDDGSGKMHYIKRPV